MVCVAWGYRERSMRGFVWTRFGCAFLRSLRGSACRPAEWCFIFAAIAHRQDSSTMYTIVCAEAISSDALCGASSRSSEIFREGVRGRSTQRRQNRRPIESNELPSPSTRKSDRQPLADAISGLDLQHAPPLHQAAPERACPAGAKVLQLYDHAPFTKPPPSGLAPPERKFDS